MEDHLVVTSDEHKVLKQFKTRLQKRHHVAINMPDTVESSESDVIFVTIVGEKINREFVKKFLSEKMKPRNEKVEVKKNIITITLSDSEDSVLSSDTESKENSVCVLESIEESIENSVRYVKELREYVLEESKENSVCVLEEPNCANNYPNFEDKCHSLDNSVCIIDCLGSPPSPVVNAVQNRIKRKRKPRHQKWRNKRGRIEDNLKTIEVDVLEVSSTTEVCEVSSTTEETVKKAQPEKVKLADFIPLGQTEKSKLKTTEKGTDKSKLIEEVKSDVILLKEPTSTPRPLRPVVIDGSNVAMEHGRVSHCFSAKGIQLAVEYFLKRGHTDVHVFVPKFRRFSNPHHSFPTKDPEIMEELAKKQIVVFTPSRRVNGKCIASYDDRFIVELASRNGGVIVSNDNYRDLIGESDLFKETIEKRLLMFCFVGDLFMIPSDPLGRNGPSLEDFLSFPPESKT